MTGRTSLADLLRVGVLRVLLLAVAMAVLALPVGEERGTSFRRVSVVEAVGELAEGRLGVSILSGLVAGGSLAGESLYRLAIAAAALVAYLLSGLVRGADAAPAADRRRCPHCRGWVARSMASCPSCGRPIT